MSAGPVKRQKTDSGGARQLTVADVGPSLEPGRQRRTDVASRGARLALIDRLRGRGHPVRPPLWL